MPLSDNSLIPLYRQVMDSLSADIENGTYPVGTRIPSETELSDIYDVSRITVRRAVTELSSEGILTKKQGKGTFVNAPRLTSSGQPGTSHPASAFPRASRYGCACAMPSTTRAFPSM